MGTPHTLRRRGQIVRAVIEACESRRLLSGQLDPTWGEAGIAQLLGTSAAFINIQEDAAGFIVATTGEMVGRYASNGQLDTGFGANGVYQSQSQSLIADLEVLPDRSMLVFFEDGSVRKLTAAGAIDPAFGPTRVTDGGAAVVKSVERVENGFLVAGDRAGVWLKRLDANLQPVASYGTAGGMRVTTPVGMSALRFEDLAVAPDGTAIIAASLLSGAIAGFGNLSLGVFAVRSDGTLSPTFGDQGLLLQRESSPNPVAVGLDSFGRVVVCASTSDSGRLVFSRFDPDGSPDLTFGEAGKRTLNITNGLEVTRDATLLADGSIVAVGTASVQQPSGAGFFSASILRLDSFGDLDLDYGSNGRLLIKPLTQNEFFSVTVDSSGQVLAGGKSYGGPAPAFASLVRVTAPSPASLVHALDNRTLTLQGGAGKDLFELSQDGSSLRVRGAGQELFFDTADIDALSIQTGDAADTLILRGVTTPLSIDLGAGNDLIDTDGLAPMTIVGGAGRDSVIANGAGDIALDATGIDLTHRISLTGVERWFVNGSADADVVEIRGMPPASTEVQVDLSTGADDVRITASALGTLAFAGAGAKRLTIDHSGESAAHAYRRVTGRIGFDGVTFDARLFGEVTIRGGSGNDTASVQPALAPLVFDGGAGTDRLDFINIGIVPPSRSSAGPGAGAYALNPFAPVSFLSTESDVVLSDQIAPFATTRIERASRLALIVETHEPIALPTPDMIEVIDLATGQRLPTSAYSILPTINGTGFGFEVRFVPWQINGRYEVLVPSAVLTDSAGNVASDETVALNHLRADTNDDGAVSFDDVLTLLANFGKTNATRIEGDLDYDGVVGFSDLLMIAQDLGRMLTVAPTTTATPARARRDTTLSLLE